MPLSAVPADRPALSAYRSISLEKDWVHEAYLGWTVLERSDSIKVLMRHYGPLRRLLVIGSAPDDFEKALSRPQAFAGHTQIVVHDLSQAPATQRRLAGREFAPLADSARLLNKATFVFDLSQPQDALVQQANSQRKRQLKTAEKNGVTAKVNAFSPKASATLFFDRYTPMAKRNQLQLPPREAVERMLSDGAAFCVTAGQQDAVNAVLLVYHCGPSGYFLHGARGEGEDYGAGTAVHFAAMAELRTRGCRWYDFGGVASLDERDGIFRFKQDFGATLVHLGGEWVWTGPVFAAVQRWRQASSEAPVTSTPGP
jgi:FemAB family